MSVPSALVTYKNSRHRIINEYLIKKTVPAGKTKADMEKMVRDISNAMTVKNPVATGEMLYRGAYLIELGAETEDRIEIGKSIVWKAFISTSRRISTAERFACGNSSKIIIAFETQGPVRCYDFTKISKADKNYFKNLNNEQEVLLDRGTSGKIVGIDNRGRKTVVKVLIDSVN